MEQGSKLKSSYTRKTKGVGNAWLVDFKGCMSCGPRPARTYATILVLFAQETVAKFSPVADWARDQAPKPNKLPI